MWALILALAFAKGPSKGPPADLGAISRAIPTVLGSPVHSPKSGEVRGDLQRFMSRHTYKEEGAGDNKRYVFTGLGLVVEGTPARPRNGCPATYVATSVTVRNAQRFRRLPGGIDTSMTWKEAKKHLKKNDRKVKKEKDGDIIRLNWNGDWSDQRRPYGCGAAFIQRSGTLVFGDAGLRRAIYAIDASQSPD